MNKIYILLIAFFTFLYSCKTATKAYQKGNYSEAIALSIKKLQKNSNDAEAKAVLQKAYNDAVSRHESRIRTLSNSNDDDRWAQTYNEYKQLQNLYELVRPYPSIAKIVNATDYSSYLNTYREKSSEAHFERGMALMAEDNKAAYRDAYNEFRLALKYDPNNSDIKKKLQQAYDKAVINVLVLPLDNNRGYMYSNSYQLRNFENDFVRNLSHNVNNRFVKFISDWNGRSQRTEPDEILEMRLGPIVMGQPYDERQTRQVSKQVVVKETVYKPDSVVKQYATVYAQITTTRRTMVSEGELYVAIKDRQGRWLWSDNFRGQHRWQIEFATYTGDERALSSSDRALLNRRDDYYNRPDQDDVLREILRDIENEAGHRLRNHYSRYN